MQSDTILGYALVVLVVFISYKIYQESDWFQLKCVVSTVDGDKYCVRERKNLGAAADLLAKTTEKMEALVTFANERYGEDARVKRLVSKFNPDTIVETLPTSEYPAYSENKGQKIAFCLNKKKNDDNNLIDENTLMFVAIHEMAHVASAGVGHGEEFWSNFKYLLMIADEANLYRPVDYKKENKEYCGMTITDNPFYN
jgi:hypothetical protein